MGDYSVGKKCSGRIINIYQGNLIVELEQNVIGRVLNGAEQTSVDQGSIVDVVVKQNDDQGILLDFVSVSKRTEVSADNVVKPWNNWKDIPAGHNQAKTAMLALRSHTDAFLRELSEARKEWEDAKSSSQQIYDSVTSSARKQFEDEKNGFTNECKNNVRSTEAKSNVVSTVVNACDEFINNVSGSAQSSARSAMEDVKKRQSEVMAAISSKVAAYRKLCNLYIANSKRTRNDKLDKARTEQIDRDTQAERRFEAKRKNICDSRRSDISTGFNKATIHAYQSEIISSRFNAINYECPNEVPDYIMLGSIGLSIPNKSQDDMSVIQAVELQTSDIATKSSGEYIVEIPYAQRL